MDVNTRIEESLSLMEEAENLGELEDHFKKWRKDQRAQGKARVAKDKAAGNKLKYVPLIMKAIRGISNIDKNQTSGEQIVVYVTEKEGVKRLTDALIRLLGSKPKGDGYPAKNPSIGKDLDFWFDGNGDVYVSYSWEYRLSDNSIRKTRDGKRIISVQILVS